MNKLLFNSFLNETHVGRMIKNALHEEIKDKDQEQMILNMMSTFFYAGLNYQVTKEKLLNKARMVK